MLKHRDEIFRGTTHVPAFWQTLCPLNARHVRTYPQPDTASIRKLRWEIRMLPELGEASSLLASSLWQKTAGYLTPSQPSYLTHSILGNLFLLVNNLFP